MEQWTEVDVTVIGAGPAGLIAAAEAAKCGNRTILLEKNSKVGRKLYISGKGRCNITNRCDITSLIKNTPGNGNFLYSAFNGFGPEDIMEYLSKLGVETKVERGNRVFPLSDKASDVVDALYNNVLRNNVDLITEAKVTGIQCESQICRKSNNETMENSENDIYNGNEMSCMKRVEYIKDGKTYIIESENVVIATGGVSYPLTGSTGDGYIFAEKVGHTIIEPKPSLIPFVVAEKWVKDLQGLSLRNVAITLIKNGTTKIFSDFGEMLFTHYGVTGPLILSASSRIRSAKYEDLELFIDLKPALSSEELDVRIKKDFSKYVNRNFINALDDLLPQSLIPVVVMLSGINESKLVNQVTKEERQKLLETLKNFKVTPVKPRPIEEAIVTAGGVCIKEINPKTMESKIVSGIYFAGEVIDVDCYTGGFNITAALATGYASVRSISQK